MENLETLDLRENMDQEGAKETQEEMVILVRRETQALQNVMS